MWANRLSMERDISLELELRRVEDKIASDQLIATLSAIQNSNGIILNRIIESYMPRASQDYDIIVELFPENVKDKGAIAYFTEMISRGKVISADSRFRYMRDSGGHSLYAGSFAYYNPGSGVTMMLMRVSPKSNRENKGYARLLGYSAPGDVLIPARYSYAKYSNKSLTSYKGNYSYPTIVDDELEKEIEEADDGVVRMNGYTHFVNKISDNNLIIVSRPKTEDFSYIVAFLFLTLVSSFFTLLEPVRMNCPGTPPLLSHIVRTASQITGASCHSSIRRGVSPFRRSDGLEAAVARYSSLISTSCKLMELFAF